MHVALWDFRRAAGMASGGGTVWAPAGAEGERTGRRGARSNTTRP